MKNIAIITDTDSSLPVDLTAKYGIRQVPINVIIEGEIFQTGVDIDDHLLFEMLKQVRKYPTTSAPSPEAFAKAFRAAILEGIQSIICICVSGKVSSSYDAAVLASQMFQHDIVVIDSQNLSMGQGFMALTAAEAVLNGATRDEVLENLAPVRNRIHTFAILPSLKYIALSGRLNKHTANMADILDIKPILTVQEGKLEVISRQRTVSKAIDKMFELMINACNGKAIERGAIIHADCPEKAQNLQKKINISFPELKPFLLTEFTPGLSLHTGPGTIGITILTRE
ncbi:MAG: DegV family protein [Bellilinea sp.]|jgi:DegV family protein with EDD domain